MIRLVAIDLDETLLNDEGNISSGNILAIRRAVAKGVKVTLATGRMAATSRGYARELGLDVPIITYHGALIEQALTGEILYRKTIPVELAAEIIEILQKKEIHAQLFIKDRVFVSKTNAYSEAYAKMVGLAVEETDISALLENEPEGLEKILCIADEAILKKETEEVRQIYGDRLHFTSSKPYYLDMIHKEVNKGSALKALADQLGLHREEVMAIGDSTNDAEMISFAGIGVAMENAYPEIKKIADHITSSNSEDGVAKAIEKYVFDENTE